MTTGIEPAERLRMAGEDGFGRTPDPDVYGDTGAAIRGVTGANKFTKVADETVIGQAHEDLLAVEEELESSELTVRSGVTEAVEAVDAHEGATIRVEQVDVTCEVEDLPPAANSRRASIMEIFMLSLLGIGDIILNSVAFQLFGISSHGFLGSPVSAVAIASSVTVAALLFLAKAAGENLRELLHHRAQLCHDRDQPELVRENRRRVADLHHRVGTTLLWFIGGGVSLLLGIALIRKAELSSSGFPAETLPFFLIQGAVFLAGVAVAYSHHHPYGKAWQRARADEDRTGLELELLRDDLTAQAGHHNALLRRREALLDQLVAWIKANHAETEGWNEYVLRAMALAIPEGGILSWTIPSDLPTPVMPTVVQEVEDYRNGGTSRFKRYKPIELERLLARLQEVEVARHGRASEHRAHAALQTGRRRQAQLADPPTADEEEPKTTGSEQSTGAPSTNGHDHKATRP